MAIFDNDQDEEWLAQQAAQAEAAQPQAADAGPWAKARELMNKQSQMRYEAPESLRKPIVAAEAPKRNDWGMIAAMMLNLAGNKGKDLGNIVMQGVQNRNQQLRDWRAENSPAALQEREMRQIQMRNADRQSFDRDRAQLGEQAAQEMQIANAEQADERFQGQQIMAQANHQDQVDYQNRSLEQQAAQSAANLQLHRDQMRQSAAQAAAARAQAARFHEDTMNEAINARQDQYAHADASQQRAFDQQLALNAADNQTKKDVYALSHPTPVAPQGYRVRAGNEQQFNQAMSSPKIMSDILTQTGNARQIQETLGELMRLREASSSASNKKLYDAALKTLIGDRSQEGSTGVLSGTEFERYLADLPEYGAMGNVSTIRGAYDVMHGRNPAMETLKGIKDRYRASNLAKLSPYGIEYDEEPAAGGGSMALQPTDTQDLLGGIPGLSKRR